MCELTVFRDTEVDKCLYLRICLILLNTFCKKRHTELTVSNENATLFFDINVFTSGRVGDFVLILCTINSFVVMLSVYVWEFQVSLIPLEVWRATDLIP